MPRDLTAATGQRSLSPREETGYECDHLRQVARDLATGEWHHVDGGVIGAVCSSGPYEVTVEVTGEHTLNKLWLAPPRH